MELNNPLSNQDRQFKILIADDYETIRDIFRQVLAFTPFECCIVADGQYALEEFTRALEAGHPFDFVILDVGMPRRNGLEAIAAMRAVETNYNAFTPINVSTPIALLTAYAEGIDLETQRELGISAVWQKPGGVLEIGKRINQTLGLSEGVPESQGVPESLGIS